MESLIVYLAQFSTVYLLGVQSLMVRDHNYVGAFLGSLFIGICQFYIYNVTDTISMLSFNWYVFILAGPMAIMLAMRTQPCLVRLIHKVSNKWKK